MKTTLKTIDLWTLCASLSAGVSLGGEPQYPVKASEHERYFMDQRGDPVFWLGTTQWQLFREYKLEEARLIIEKNRSRRRMDGKMRYLSLKGRTVHQSCN